MTSVVALLFLFSACTTSSTPEIVQSESYKLGVQDGCATASGTYTKNSDSFNNDIEYADGWYAGRKNCNPMNSKE